MVHLIDIMPTLCELAGATYPTTYRGRKITPTPGLSMAAFLTRADAPIVPRTLYWQHENHAAVRQGDWKLVTSNDRHEEAWELYDLSQDRSESENLLRQRPAIAERLRKSWRQWAQQASVLPFPERRRGSKGIPWPPRPWPK